MSRILDGIDSPDNVKQLSIPELEQLAAEEASPDSVAR